MPETNETDNKETVTEENPKTTSKESFDYLFKDDYDLNAIEDYSRAARLLEIDDANDIPKRLATEMEKRRKVMHRVITQHFSYEFISGLIVQFVKK